MKLLLADVFQEYVSEPTIEFFEGISKHQPVGKLGGWTFALFIGAEFVINCTIYLVENIVATLFNLLACPFSSEARKDLKETSWEILSSFPMFGLALIIPFTDLIPRFWKA